MLSYQHSYHAGNFADVHKHITLVHVLSALLKKPTPICFIDAHAGRGYYDLKSAEADKTGEAIYAVVKLLELSDFPESVLPYHALLEHFNQTHDKSQFLSRYPGSPALAFSMLRDVDRAILFELHPKEIKLLRNFINDKRIAIHARDCYEGLPAVLPPDVKRGLVLIDPSYEVKTEYVDVVELTIKAQKRWATAAYMLWYPILPETRHKKLLRLFSESGLRKILHSRLEYPNWTGGMTGSGLLIINPPWQLEAPLKESGLFLAEHLMDGKGLFKLDWLVPE